MSKQQVCVFAGIKEEKRHGDEPIYECVHGKTVTWTTARRLLGLPAKPFEEKPDAKSR